MTERNRNTSRDDDRGGRDRGSRDEGRGSRERDGGREEPTRGGRDRGDSGRGRERGDSRGSSSGFSYQKRSAEDMNKRASMGSKDFDSYLRDDVKMFKPNDGANTIRILPPTWAGPKHYGQDLWVHYGVGPDSQTYLCNLKMKGDACPICEERDRARKSGESEEYIKDLEPVRRVLLYLVDREHEKDGVQAWASPWTIDRDIIKISVDRRTGDVLPIDDPEEGFDVEFDKTGKGVGTKYVGMAIARRESSLGDSKWLEFAVKNPLPEILEYYSYDHVEKAFGGGGAHKTRSDKDSRGDDRDSRSRDRDPEPRDAAGHDNKQQDSRRSRDDPKEPEYDWEGIHSMSTQELDDLVATHGDLAGIDPNKADSDEQLADWICADLKIYKPKASSGRREVGREPDNKVDEGDHRDKLRSMREGRR